MSCIITRKSRASIWGKLHHCQTYIRHINHHRKYTACSSRDSFAYSESRHDSYPQFPRSWQGTRGLQTRSHRKKKRLHFKSLALLKQARLTSNDELLFLFLNVDIVPRNTIPGKLAYISKSKCVRIIAIKTEWTQIHFLFATFLVAVVRLELKVPSKNSELPTCFC